MALDDFLKQKLAFADENQAQLTCFQQSDVKTNLRMRSGILNQCAREKTEEQKIDQLINSDFGLKREKAAHLAIARTN